MPEGKKSGNMLHRLGAVGMGLVTASVFFWMLSSVTADINSLAVDQAKAMTTLVKKLRGYYTGKVVGVAKSAGIRPHFSYQKLRDQGQKAIPLPATMVHELSEIINKDATLSGTKLELYSKFPFGNRADRKLDKFQDDAWEYFMKADSEVRNKGVFTREEDIDGAPYLRVAIADLMQVQMCVNCHNNTQINWGAVDGKQWFTPKADWKLGDLRGVLEVKIPATRKKELVNGTIIKGILMFVMVICFAFMMSMIGKSS